MLIVTILESEKESFRIITSSDYSVKCYSCTNMHCMSSLYNIFVCSLNVHLKAAECAVPRN